MKRLPLLFVAALLGVAVSAPAQFQRDRRVGRPERGVPVVAAPVGHGHGHGGFRTPRQSGRWEIRYEQVLVPGYWEDRHVPPTYGWIYSLCGHRHWGIIDRGGCQRVWVPPRWESRPQRVWVPC